VVRVLALLNQEKENEREQRRAAAARERQLESQYSHRLEDVEQWSFIFTALLETCVRPGVPAMSDTDSRFSHDGQRSQQAEGGGAYDLAN
jgi:hypothetical protein